jgi:hypothetical protein
MSRQQGSHTGERLGASLLVRCWLEPREDASESPIVRGYVKNLKTGEELFIKDVDSVGQQILRSLEPAAAAEGDERAAEGAR